MEGENLSILRHSLLRARQRFTGIIAADSFGKGVNDLDHEVTIEITGWGSSQYRVLIAGRRRR
jgi:hypothetical protein